SSIAPPDPTPAATNQAPTDISLSASAFTEDTLGVVVGTLCATDDNAEGATFTVADDSFEITEGSLKLKDSIA
ncbi:DUF4856 domain-containing protein, partial [Pseudoalteromonas phenolica]